MEYPLVRIDKLHPDGTPRASLYGYRVPDHDGVPRAFVPPGTRRIHVNGIWRHDEAQIFAFDPEQRFVVTCYWGRLPQRSLYIDIVRSTRIERDRLEYVDLYLDVMVSDGVIREKDEELLARLDRVEAQHARDIRDRIREGIDRREPLLDPESVLWSLPADTEALRPRARRRTRTWLAGRP